MDWRQGLSTQEYRATYDYRSEYFKANPGLWGKVWFCSQCGKPLFGKKRVVIDHIRPLNQGGRNHVSNCTACCQPCNSAKSDKVDYRVRRGQIFKFFEQNFSNLNRGVGLFATIGLAVGTATVNTSGRVVVKVGKTAGKVAFASLRFLVSCGAKFLSYPLRHGTFFSRIVALSLYVAIILYMLAEHTTLLNAWIGV